MEKTLVIIKPDGVEKNIIGQIINRYESNGLVLEEMKMMRATTEILKTHYAEHVGRSYFAELIDYMMSGQIVVMILSGDDAIEKVRQINGLTDPKLADKGTIRYDFAESKTKNIVHASDAVESANREINIWF